MKIGNTHARTSNIHKFQNISKLPKYMREFAISKGADETASIIYRTKKDTYDMMGEYWFSIKGKEYFGTLEELKKLSK